MQKAKKDRNHVISNHQRGVIQYYAGVSGRVGYTIIMCPILNIMVLGFHYEAEFQGVDFVILGLQ